MLGGPADLLVARGAQGTDAQRLGLAALEQRRTVRACKDAHVDLDGTDLGELAPVGADALLGLITDSDFGGGGSDNKGHFLQLMFGVNKTWSVGAKYFINEINIASGDKSDYNRLMIDTQWKWK